MKTFGTIRNPVFLEEEPPVLSVKTLEEGLSITDVENETDDTSEESIIGRIHQTAKRTKSAFLGCSSEKSLKWMS